MSCAICGCSLTPINENIDHVVIDFALAGKQEICVTCLEDIRNSEL